MQGTLSPSPSSPLRQSPARSLRAWLALGGLLLSVLPAACGPGGGRPLVRVGDQVVTEDELRRELTLRLGPLLLLEMIDTRLILQAAGQQQVQVSEGSLRLKYEQAVARVGSERDLDQKLQRLHRTRDEFQELVRADCLLDRLALQTLQLTDEDLRRYYQAHQAEFSREEQVRARLILFTARENGEAVAEALKSPEADFAGLARAFSEDPATRDQGGDTGFFARGDYAAAISSAAFRLKPGQISGLLAVPDGFALLKLEERRPAGPIPFAEVRSAIRARLEMERLDAARQAWLKKARQEAQLVISDEELARQVRLLMAGEVRYDPTNLTPEMPTAPR